MTLGVKEPLILTEADEPFLEQLPLKRIIIMRYFAAGRSHKDISIMLSIPIGTVKSGLYRGRCELERLRALDKFIRNRADKEVMKYE